MSHVDIPRLESSGIQFGGDCFIYTYSVQSSSTYSPISLSFDAASLALMIKKEIPYPCNSKQENKCCCSIIYPSFFHIISPTNTSRLYRKRIATSTLKRHRIRRTVELVAALGTRADLHRRRLRLPRLQELQSLHTQRVVGNVHQTVIMRRHPSLERGRNSYQFCDRWKNSRRLLHTPWSKGL